jgi:AcrR family transcriptional regulator
MGRPRSDIAPRIVHAARARFLYEGVDGTSLRDIAKDARTSIGMVYYYYATKDELFLAVIEEIYAKLLEDLALALAPDVPVRDRLRRVFTRIGGASDEELQVIRLVVREALVSSERLGVVLERFRRGHLPMLLAALADGVARGEVEGEHPLPLLMMCSFAIGLAPQMIKRVAGATAPFDLLPKGPRLADTLVDILFSGIGPREKPQALKKKRQ